MKHNIQTFELNQARLIERFEERVFGVSEILDACVALCAGGESPRARRLGSRPREPRCGEAAVGWHRGSAPPALPPPRPAGRALASVRMRNASRTSDFPKASRNAQPCWKRLQATLIIVSDGKKRAFSDPSETARLHAETQVRTRGGNQEPCVFPHSRITFTRKSGLKRPRGFGWIREST